MKMSDTMAIPRNRYMRVMKYTIPSKPPDINEDPGIITKLKQPLLKKHSPVALLVLVELLHESISFFNPHALQVPPLVFEKGGCVAGNVSFFSHDPIITGQSNGYSEVSQYPEVRFKSRVSKLLIRKIK